MRHVRADHNTCLATRQARGSVIDSLVEAVLSCQPLIGEPLQIQAGGFRCHHQCQRRCVGCHHQIIGEPALEPEPRHTESAVLIIERSIDRVVAGLRNSPRHIALRAIGNLPVDGGVTSAIKQGIFKSGHDQERHQIFEHRAAPGQQCRLATGRGQQAPHCKPGFLWHLPLRNRHEAAQTSLRSEHVVGA